MSMLASEAESQQRVRLAEIRTALAEKRTAISELQLSLLLVTVPLTIHTGLMVLVGQHAFVERLHVLGPFWVLLAALLILGIWLAVHSLRALAKVNTHIRALGGDHGH